MCLSSLYLPLCSNHNFSHVCNQSSLTLFPHFLPSVQMHTQQGVPSAVWRKQFAEVAHTFQPGSERRRVRAAAPTLTLTLTSSLSLSSSTRPATGGDDLGLGGGDEQQQQKQEQKQKQKKKQSWPVDGRLSTRQGAYNDGVPWTKSPCIARQVKEQEARERGRKLDPDWTFKPNLNVDPKVAKLIKEWRPEEVFNRYKIHTYRHFDRPLAYSIQPMKFVAKKPTVDLADSRHAWRTDVEPEEGKDGRGRAYGRALWEEAMKSRQQKNDTWDELIAPSLVRSRTPLP